MLSKHSWHFDGHYAASKIKIEGKYKYVKMHRLLCAGELVDHINGDKLDNRRSNLRSVTRGQNRQNARGSNRVLQGVCPTEDGAAYIASINVGGEKIYLGYFSCPLDAAKAYDDAAREHYGEHAYTNSEKIKKLLLPK
jgi:hypothetical protein